MTEQQIKFLKSIYDSEKNAIELCGELGIKPNPGDPLGGYYNKLNEEIDYLTSDTESEFDDMFEIMPSSTEKSDNDIYTITAKGEAYIQSLNKE